MASVSRVVIEVVNSRPLLLEAISQDIVNYARAAEDMHAYVEKQVGSSVKLSAIVMALRRYSETVQGRDTPSRARPVFRSELVMKSGLCDITLVKTPSLVALLPKIYGMIGNHPRETVNVIQGDHELTIVLSEGHLKKVQALVKKETVLNVEKHLTSITMTLDKDFFYAPGVLAQVCRALAWEGINIYENISTMTEIIFIVHRSQEVRAYTALSEVIASQT